MPYFSQIRNKLIIFQTRAMKFSFEQRKVFEKFNQIKNESNDTNILIKSAFKSIDNAEIIRYDKSNKRFFIVIDSSIVYKTEIINQIICDMTQLYTIETNSNISFFSEEKWADYKDALFFNPDSKFSQKEYQNWLNNYYKIEFDFNNKSYKIHPFSKPKMNKRKTIKIKNCI